MSIKLGTNHPMYTILSESLALLPVKEGKETPTARITKKLEKGLVKFNKKTNVMSVHPDLFDTDNDLTILVDAYNDAFVSHRKGRIKGTKNKNHKVREPKVSTGVRGRKHSTESNSFNIVTHRAVRQFASLIAAQCGEVKIAGDSFVCGGVTLRYDPENVMHKTLRNTLETIKKYGVEVETEVETEVAELIVNTHTNTTNEATVTVKELRKMTVPALTKIAAKYNVKGRSEMTKTLLIETLADFAQL